MTGSTYPTLLLLRHAKSAWPDVPDHDRPLAHRGQRDAPMMGRWLRASGQVPDQVLCSTARRARETWQLARDGLGIVPPVSFEDSIYQGAAVHLLELIRQASPAARKLLVVGHDPAIPDLALMLAAPLSSRDTAGQRAAHRIRAKFPTAAIAVVELSAGWDHLASETARLTVFVTPRDLQAESARSQ
jgi:phosphohistidine phosphatase